MSEKLNKILLKPRFYIELEQSKTNVLKKFTTKLNQDSCSYSKKKSGNHIYINMPESKTHIWSPQLSIEVENMDKGSRIRGFFAPKPGIWTFFMFLHFVVGIGFMIFAALAYANYIIHSNYKFWLSMMLLAVVAWFSLYFIGQLGKAKAKTQMEELKVFLKDCLIELDIKKPHDFQS